MSVKETVMTERRAPIKNLAPERMQAELRHLRVLALELEKERDDLEQRASAVASGHGMLSRGVACHEYEKRRQAEALNQQLRQRLKEHIEIIRHLKQLIQHEARETNDDRGPSPFTYMTRDPDLFRAFHDDIQVGYRMTDSIVNTVNWVEMDRDEWRVDTRTSHHNGRPQQVLELQKQYTNPKSHYIPGVGDTRGWLQASQIFHLSGYEIEELIVQENSVAARYHNAYTHHGREFHVQQLDGPTVRRSKPGCARMALQVHGNR